MQSLGLEFNTSQYHMLCYYAQRKKCETNRICRLVRERRRNWQKRAWVQVASVMRKDGKWGWAWPPLTHSSSLERKPTRPQVCYSIRSKLYNILALNTRIKEIKKCNAQKTNIYRDVLEKEKMHWKTMKCDVISNGGSTCISAYSQLLVFVRACSQQNNSTGGLLVQKFLGQRLISMWVRRGP